MSVSDPRADEIPCSLPRRLAAILYDALVIAAIWILGTLLIVIPADRPVADGNPIFQVFLLALAFAYLYASWHFRGQTLGMRAWRIRLRSDTGRPGLTCLAIRFTTAMASAALLGAGYFWALGRRDRATWHDLASRTRLVYCPRDVRGSAPPE